MTDRAERSFRSRALGVLSFAHGGLHHVDMPRVKWFHEDHPDWARCEYVAMPDLSTFDGPNLTLLVIAAHDLCVRLSIRPGGPRGVKLQMWPRTREGDYSRRHPTLEDNVAGLRAYNERWYAIAPCYLPKVGAAQPEAE